MKNVRIFLNLLRKIENERKEVISGLRKKYSFFRLKLDFLQFSSYIFLAIWSFSWLFGTSAKLMDK